MQAGHAKSGGSGKRGDWKLPFAIPLSYPKLDRPYFRETLGTLDPVEHINHIAELGFAGIEDNRLKERPPADQERMGAALARHGLKMGCFTSSSEARLWGSADMAVREQLRADMQGCVEASKRIGGGMVTIVAGADLRVPHWYELTNMLENLRRVHDIAAKAGLVLCLEHVAAYRVPGLLLQHLSDSYYLTRAMNSPTIKLVFDTTHVQAQDGDILANLDRVWDDVSVVQLADNPGRFEPGSGEINFVALFRKLRDGGYTGLVELEHFFSKPGKEGEQHALKLLRELNGAV